MTKIIKSAKGELVDFDMLKLKQQMTSAPAPVKVTERKEFIDSKLQRRLRKAKSEIEAAKIKRNGLVEIEQKEIKVEPEVKPKTVKKIKKVEKTDD